MVTAKFNLSRDDIPVEFDSDIEEENGGTGFNQWG
jgi:hypothetical protein